MLDNGRWARHHLSVGVLRLSVLCAAIATTAACGIGVVGLEGVSGDAAAPNVDAQTDGTTGVEGSSGAGEESGAGESGGGDGPAVDAAVDVGVDVVTVDAPVDGCKPTGPENCTNGIDDDCNGLVDCADPACKTQGYACVAPAPNGWDFVAFEPASRPGCPSSLKENDVDVDPTDLTSQATCTCTCNPAGVTCYGGNYGTKGGPDNTCNQAGETFSFPGNSNCNAFGQAFTPPAYLQVTPPAPGGSCNADPTTTVPSTGATQGEYCSGETTFGAGCSGGQVCGLAPSGTQACVHHGGQTSCPGGGYATANQVGTIGDNRGCSACTCNGGPSGTCSGSINLYTGAGCTGTELSVAVDGTCDATQAPPATKYTSSQLDVNDPGATCAPPAAQPSPTGSVQLNGADTVCCP